jgi:two-component system, OmpR family, response regulator
VLSIVGGVGEVVAAEPRVGLGSRQRAVLAALAERPGRVLDRDELRSRAGLVGLSDRRCESLLVELRRRLGPDAIVTVRRRGWMLNPDAAAMAVSLVSNG